MTLAPAPRTGRSGLGFPEGSEAASFWGEAAVEAAPLFEVDKDEAMADARRIAKIVAVRWRPLCTAMGMDRDECDQYEGAFHRAVDFAAELARTKPQRNGRGANPA